MSRILAFFGLYRIWFELALAVSLVGGVMYGIHHYGNTRAAAQYALDQAAVNKQKAEASKALADETNKTRAKEAELAAFKNRQEITDAQNHELSRAQERRLTAIAGPAGRLRDPFAGRGGSGGGAASQAPASAGSGAANASEAPGLLSAGLSGFLLEQARLADEINNAYGSCRADALNLRAAVK